MELQELLKAALFGRILARSLLVSTIVSYFLPRALLRRNVLFASSRLRLCLSSSHLRRKRAIATSRRDLDPGTGDKPSEMRFASRECFSSILVFHTFPFRHRAFPLFVRLPTQRRRPAQTASWWQRQLFHAIISTFHHHCTIGYAVAFARQPLPQQLMAPVIMQWARLLGTEYLAALGSGNTGVC